MAQTTDAGKAKATGVRARVRAELTAEIKASARRQLATEGAASLSLRAIARELEMASSAIYRYFASREDLLTALIIDAYDAVGDAAETANAACDPADFAGRGSAIMGAVRSWALANPHEYALIYGSPVPGYAAPQDTIDPAIRVPVAWITVVVEAHGGGEPVPVPAGQEVMGKSLQAILDLANNSVTPEVMARAVECWAQLFGLVSLELFGHFHNSVTDTDQFFDSAVRSMVDRALS